MSCGLRGDRQLTEGHGMSRNGRPKFCRDVFAQYRQVFSHDQRSIVPTRRIFFCSCRMP